MTKKRELPGAVSRLVEAYTRDPVSGCLTVYGVPLEHESKITLLIFRFSKF